MQDFASIYREFARLVFEGHCSLLSSQPERFLLTRKADDDAMNVANFLHIVTQTYIASGEADAEAFALKRGVKPLPDDEPRWQIKGDAFPSLFC